MRNAPSGSTLPRRSPLWPTRLHTTPAGQAAVPWTRKAGVPSLSGELTTEMACSQPLAIQVEPGSVGRQQGEPFSFAQMPGCYDEEVAAVESCDLADVEPFGEGDHAGVHHLQSQ